ncbi:retrovirus-related pol polyprotein from transposon TNT 1-94 [Tanacetum coccineum]
MAISLSSLEAHPLCRFATLIDDIRLWAKNIHFTFSWVKREQNKVAHWVASHTYSTASRFSWDNTFPHDFTLLARSDLYVDTKPNMKEMKKCIFNGPYVMKRVLVPAKPVIETDPLVPEHIVQETYENTLPENHAYIDAEAETIHMILSGIGDEIYSTVDACKIAQEIWTTIERLQQDDSDLEHAQRDKNMQKSIELISKYFTKIYKPTNNNLRTSLNSRNKNVDSTPRIENDKQTRHELDLELAPTCIINCDLEFLEITTFASSLQYHHESCHLVNLVTSGLTFSYFSFVLKESPYLLALFIETSQSRQHDKSESDLTSHLPHSLFDVGSRRISIVICIKNKSMKDSVLVRFMDDFLWL